MAYVTYLRSSGQSRQQNDLIKLCFIQEIYLQFQFNYIHDKLFSIIKTIHEKRKYYLFMIVNSISFVTSYSTTLDSSVVFNFNKLYVTLTRS